MFFGVFLALLAALAHSGSFVFRKRGLENVNYKVFIAIRLSLGFFIIAILIFFIGPGLSGMTFKQALPFVITGIIGNVFGLIATTLAIHEIGASRTHALTSASPLVTAILEVFFLGEAFTVQLLLGLLAIVFGAGLLSYRLHGGKTSKPVERPFFGFGLAVYTTVAVGIFSVLQKYGLNLGATPLQGLFVRFLTALAIYAAYLLVTRPEIEAKVFFRSYSFIAATVMLTGVSLLSLFAMTTLSATLVAGLMRAAPLFTVALSAFLLKDIEEVDLQTFFSAAVIVAGAVLAITG